MWTFLPEEEEAIPPSFVLQPVLMLGCQKDAVKLRPTKGSREWSKDAILGNNKKKRTGCYVH